MQFIEVARQDLARAALALVDDPPNLLVDDRSGGIRNVLALRNRVTEENLFLVIAVEQRTELLAETPFCDHAAGDIGRRLDIHRGAGRNLLHPEDQLLGDTAAE